MSIHDEASNPSPSAIVFPVPLQLFTNERLDAYLAANAYDPFLNPSEGEAAVYSQKAAHGALHKLFAPSDLPIVEQKGDFVTFVARLIRMGQAAHEELNIDLDPPLEFVEFKVGTECYWLQTTEHVLKSIRPGWFRAEFRVTVKLTLHGNFVVAMQRSDMKGGQS